MKVKETRKGKNALKKSEKFRNHAKSVYERIMLPHFHHIMLLTYSTKIKLIYSSKCKYITYICYIYVFKVVC